LETMIKGLTKDKASITFIQKIICSSACRQKDTG
jgi:hypothetical protein